MLRGKPAAPASADRKKCYAQGTPSNSTDAAQALVELRELDRRRAQLIRNLRRVYGYGPRAAGELAIELATRVDALSMLDERAQRFADGLDPDLLRAIGCHDFPCS